MNTITVNDLSPDQRSAYNDITNWIRNQDRGLLSLGGYAGSGKSTLVSLVAEQVRSPAFCAFTGKATSVLRRKLNRAGTSTASAWQKRINPMLDASICDTIHGLIYQPCECREPETVEVSKPCPAEGCVVELELTSEGVAACRDHGEMLTAAVYDALGPQKRFAYPPRDETGKCKYCDGVGWHRREALDRDCDLIIVDEASMVDDTMLTDLQSYNVPILAVGDHGQLPPVRGQGSVMKSPHLRLEKIHRQAEGNPIIALSKIVRETGYLPDSDAGDVVRFRGLREIEQIISERYSNASPARLLEMGLVCYTNRRRVGLNGVVRRVRGTAEQPPMTGEHVVCLRNMRSQGGRPPVANGMRGVLVTDAKYVNDSNEEQILAGVELPEDEIEACQYKMLVAQFGREKTFTAPEELAQETSFRSFNLAGCLFDFGWAMTCHKMQGSQVDDLVVCAERPGPVDNDSWKKWLYTAVTRAVSKLTVLR